MGPVRREVFTHFREGRPVLPGFVSYVRRATPVLLHRSGWVDGADTYDDFADSLSHDNGSSWSVPRPSLRSQEVPGGRLRYGESACFFDADREKLFAFTSRAFYPGDRFDPAAPWEIVEDEYDAARGSWRGGRRIDVGIPGGLSAGCCSPILTSRGSLLLSASGLRPGGNGRPLRQALVIRGSRGQDGSFTYTRGQPVAVDPELCSRGLRGGELAELRDGRVAMVCRGDDDVRPGGRGRSWACLSADDGRSWSEPSPLGCDAGRPMEPAPGGSALLRSVRSGQLYWIGGLCMPRAGAVGEQPQLVLAEVREEPLVLRRSTLEVIEEQAPLEPGTPRLPAFRAYQDRLTGELVLFLTRFGERSGADWREADYYRYRVALD